MNLNPRKKNRRPAQTSKNISQKEMKYYGLRACEYIWQQRPEEIVRVYLDQSLVRPMRSLLKWCAAQKKPYKIIPSNELERVTESVHHEGICLVALEPAPLTLNQLLDGLPDTACLLYLDGVGNPHNIGSIVRTCAHFGVTAILGASEELPKSSPSMYRIASGGMEHVSLVSVDQPKNVLSRLKEAGFAVVGTSSHSGCFLHDYQFSARTLIVMGSESHGMSKALSAIAADTLMIPGTGQVESLNVSVATSLFLYEFYRQNHHAVVPK